MQVVISRANQLAVELLTNGAQIFKPISAPKK
jgi:hypothetical protein